ncbi:MAG: hypothetical protein HUJ98_03055, partial [Bacteroidaceae bacterium]|nr:hypothetical protein [Bacteroidaceae bacterium]
ERYIHFNNMAYGQGASMALPIYGKYLTQVFADKTLPYSQNDKFIFPEDFQPCLKEDLGGVPIDQAEMETPEEAIEGQFD